MSTGPSTDRPLPAPTATDRPFWDACREHRLVMPHCLDCDNVWFPPYDHCPRCQSDRIVGSPVSGRGTVFGAAVFERPYLKSMPPPYHVALVQLEEGPMIYGTVVDVDHLDVHAGMAVTVVFDDVTSEITLPRFRHREES